MRRHRLTIVSGAAFGALGGLSCVPAAAQTAPDLRDMSIEQLADLQVTSVSKRAEPLSDAPAAVYVITHDEIVQSGAQTLPEILRLAPNLQVAVINASSYAISARGFNVGLNASLSNKLLVLVDGRSVYTPLFGGVLWDEQDIPPEDIERIEVISGPGATLWGANAVNGVINVITHKAGAAPDGTLDLKIGNQASSGSLEYGGKVGENLSYRVYARGLFVRHDQLSTGADAHDGLSEGQGGFRIDWTAGKDAVTLEGSLLHGREQQAGALADLGIWDGHLQVNWRHALDGGSTLNLFGYFDEDRRFTASYDGFWLQTYDLELQRDLTLGANQIVWGAGGRLYRSHFANSGSVVYLPANRTESLLYAFAQDTVALTHSLDLTAGLKLEKDPFSKVAPLPNVRLAWKPSDQSLLWAAVSRAVRAPTLFDVDLQDNVVPGVIVIQGNKSFRSEKLTAFEAGGRAQLSDAASFSVSAYYNVYDDLRSVEIAPVTPFPLIIQWGNLAKAHTYGVEAWGQYQVAPWWRLKAGFKLQHLDISFKPGASALNNTGALGNDPDSQALLGSTMRLGKRLSWEADFRYVGALPSPHIPSYAELDTNLVWAVTNRWQLSVSGANLLHKRHLEYELAGATTGTEVPRSVSVGARLKF
jgi:iron complex outermembrane receptor protein